MLGEYQCPVGFNVSSPDTHHHHPPTHPRAHTLIFSENIFLKSINIWEEVSAVWSKVIMCMVDNFHPHNISTTGASCSSSELSTAPRDVFAFPLGRWEPSASRGLWLCPLPSSNQTAIFYFLCPIYSLFSTSPFSWSLSASFFAFPLVPKVVGSQFLIRRAFPEILQLLGCNCEVIVSQTWECCQACQLCRVLKNWDCSFSLIFEIFRCAVDHINADLSANTSFQIQDGFL